MGKELAVALLGLGALYCFKKGGVLGTLLGVMMTYDAATNLWKIGAGDKKKDTDEEKKENDDD